MSRDMKKERILTDNWFLRESESTEVMKIPQMPMQVHDILYHYGKIGDSYQWGKTEDCRWSMIRPGYTEQILK